VKEGKKKVVGHRSETRSGLKNTVIVRADAGLSQFHFPFMYVTIAIVECAFNAQMSKFSPAGCVTGVAM
jgi:hypothetical protein